MLTAFCTGFLFIASGMREESATSVEKVRTFVSILPQSYFVERVGGGLVTVDVLVQPGQEPHTYEPTPRQMAALSEAQIYFSVGVPYEDRVLGKVQSTNEKLFIVHTDEGIKRRMLEVHPDEGVAHAERSGGESSVREDGERPSNGGGEPDPHIWLGPEQIGMQARNIYRALADIDPSHAQEYRNNLDAFLADIEVVDAKLSALFERYRGRSFYVFHPAFGYFADAYGLTQVPVELSGKQPTPRQIEGLITRARNEGVRVIFVSPQFDHRSAKTIAEAIDGAVVTIDPLARDVLANLQGVAAAIEGAFR